MEDAAALTIAAPHWLAAVLLGVLGAIFGSFIAAIVIRWPQDRSVMHGRSTCDACGRVLGAAELVPLMSGILSGGKCRTCRAAIDPLHWRIEALALMIGAGAGALLPLDQAAAAALFGWLLLALAALDVTEFWLPDVLTLALAMTGLIVGVIGIGVPLTERVIGGVGGFASLWAIGAGYRALRGQEGLGGGDPKLLGAIGLWIGWRLLPVVLFLAALTGLGIALWRMLTGRDVSLGDRLPLGALLAIAAYPTLILMLMLGV